MECSYYSKCHNKQSKYNANKVPKTFHHILKERGHKKENLDNCHNKSKRMRTLLFPIPIIYLSWMYIYGTSILHIGFRILGFRRGLSDVVVVSCDFRVRLRTRCTPCRALDTIQSKAPCTCCDPRLSSDELLPG